MFCKHEWTLLSETTTESRIELLARCGVEKVKGLSSPADRKLIQMVSCKKCGKLRRFVEKI